jgi:uncharacterized protein (TIGR00266 family)
MQIEIKYNPGSSVAKCTLAPSETLSAEGGSMVCMSGDMNITTSTHKKSSGNPLKALTRMFSGEGFFMNHYSAPDGGEVWLAPTLTGDMMVKQLDNESLIVQGGSWLASSEDIEVDFNWQGFKSMFSGESVFWLNVHGTGQVILNSFGTIYPIQVDGEHIVDTGHIVAFESGLDFSISKAGSSFIGSILGGEGLVCRFKGQGTVWCQSHNPPALGKLLGPKLKQR